MVLHVSLAQTAAEECVKKIVAESSAGLRLWIVMMAAGDWETVKGAHEQNAGKLRNS